MAKEPEVSYDFIKWLNGSEKRIEAKYNDKKKSEPKEETKPNASLQPAYKGFDVIKVSEGREAYSPLYSDKNLGLLIKGWNRTMNRLEKAYNDQKEYIIRSEQDKTNEVVRSYDLLTGSLMHQIRERDILLKKTTGGEKDNGPKGRAAYTRTK
jgi:hypothetical protein